MLSRHGVYVFLKFYYFNFIFPAMLSSVMALQLVDVATSKLYSFIVLCPDDGPLTENLALRKKFEV